MSQALDVNDLDWRAFVAAARLRPQDDTPLLAWCDWLQETYPGCAFERCVRAAVEVARRHPRNALASYGWVSTSRPTDAGAGFHTAAWEGFLRSWAGWPPFAGNLPHLRRQCLVHRGLPLRVVCREDYWLDHADAICAMGPVGEVVFTTSLDFYEHAGESVVQLTAMTHRLHKRLPHVPHNPHYTRIVHADDWADLDPVDREGLTNRIGCDLYRTAWFGQVGSFRVERGREDRPDGFSEAAEGVPAWPPSLTWHGGSK